MYPEGNIEFVRQFIEHAHFTKTDLRGEVLVIGPGPDLLDLFPIVPFLKNITRLDLVSEEHGGRIKTVLQGVLEQHYRNANRKKEIASQTYTFKRFQDLSKEYDRAVFYGAPPSFGLNKHYEEIPQILKPGGVFYGTVNLDNLPTNHMPQSDCHLKTFTDIPPHPTYGSPWTGIVIEKGR